MTTRVYSSISQDTTLAAGGITATATTMVVATGTGNSLMGGITLTAGDIFTVALDPDTTSEEIVYITAQSSDTFTITRAQAGTAGVVHAAGAIVRHVLTSSDLNWFNNMIQSDAAITSTPTITGGSASAINKKIQVRKDTAANWTSSNPTLASGEFGFETDTNKFKIGDGSSVWNGLPYASDVLPSQTGNSGKYLTTDGSVASWGTITIPAQTDQTPTVFMLMGA